MSSLPLSSCCRFPRPCLRVNASLPAEVLAPTVAHGPSEVAKQVRDIQVS